MTTVKNYWDNQINYDAAVEMMDDEIREELAYEIAPCTDQEFFDAYCELHKKKFREEFCLNEENPIY